jgi:hypothetical protein
LWGPCQGVNGRDLQQATCPRYQGGAAREIDKRTDCPTCFVGPRRSQRPATPEGARHLGPDEARRPVGPMASQWPAGRRGGAGGRSPPGGSVNGDRAGSRYRCTIRPMSSADDGRGAGTDRTPRHRSRSRTELGPLRLPQLPNVEGLPAGVVRGHRGLFRRSTRRGSRTAEGRSSTHIVDERLGRRGPQPASALSGESGPWLELAVFASRTYQLAWTPPSNDAGASLDERQPTDCAISAIAAASRATAAHANLPCARDMGPSMTISSCRRRRLIGVTRGVV